MPWMWIVAGPNGAGKSTFASRLLEGVNFKHLTKLNADEVTAKLRAADPFSGQSVLNLRAAQIVDDQVDEYIDEKKDFLVETVLSSGKYRDDLHFAKTMDFKIGLIYISLHPPELSPLRVGERVLKGGHQVDRQTALDRYAKSHEQLAWFAPRADRFFAYDNSRDDGTPVCIAWKSESQDLVHLQPGVNPAIDAALGIAFPVT